MIFGSCRNLQGEDFKACAKPVADFFDLIIPVERFDQGIIVLHKMTCLPLSDFAYLKMKDTSSNLQMSPQNMSVLLSYHKDKIWFFDYAAKKFEKTFDHIQREMCSKHNCEQELEELAKENQKLANDCGIQSSQSSDPVSRTLFTFDFEKMRKDDDLALKCLPFALDGVTMKLHSSYNDVLRKNNSETFKKELASIWLKEMSKYKQFF